MRKFGERKNKDPSSLRSSTNRSLAVNDAISEELGSTVAWVLPRSGKLFRIRPHFPIESGHFGKTHHSPGGGGSGQRRTTAKPAANTPASSAGTSVS